jgi:hypothetical protein
MGVQQQVGNSLLRKQRGLWHDDRLSTYLHHMNDGTSHYEKMSDLQTSGSTALAAPEGSPSRKAARLLSDDGRRVRRLSGYGNKSARGVYLALVVKWQCTSSIWQLWNRRTLSSRVRSTC